MKKALDGASHALSGAFSLANEMAAAVENNQRYVESVIATITQIYVGSKYDPPPAELLAPPPFEVTARQLETATKQVHADWIAACQRTEREPSAEIQFQFRTITDYLEEWGYGPVPPDPKAGENLAFIAHFNALFAEKSRGCPIHRAC